jgi:hypothetical protein
MRRAPVAVGGSSQPGRRCVRIGPAGSLLAVGERSYFSRPGDDTVCPDVLGEIEEHAQVIGDALGIERPLVTYYKYDGYGDYSRTRSAATGAAACAAQTPPSTRRRPSIDTS